MSGPLRKPPSDAARAKGRGTSSNAARDGRRRAQRENPKDAKLVEHLTGADRKSKEDRAEQAREAGKLGGRPVGSKSMNVWDQLRERLARRVNAKLGTPGWFNSLSEHSVTQLLKLVVPASQAVATGAGEQEEREGMQVVKISLMLDPDTPLGDGADVGEDDGDAAQPVAAKPITATDILERCRRDRLLLKEVLSLLTADEIMAAAETDTKGHIRQVIKDAGKRYVENSQRMKQIREAEQASRRRARIFADPDAWTR